MKIKSVMCTFAAVGTLLVSCDRFASGASSAAAGVAEHDRHADGRNAAELYRAAWERHADLLDAFDAEQQRAEIQSTSAEWTPEEETMAVLRACRPLVEDLIAATRAAEADWGFGDSDDFFVELPHLGMLRQSARLLAADARARMALNDHEGAAERIAAMFRMSQHLRDDEIIISSLVSMAIAELGVQMAELLITEARPAPEHLAPIRAAVGAIPKDDPFSMLDAIKGEHRRMRSGLPDWILAGSKPEDAPPVLQGTLSLAGAVVMTGQLERFDASYEALIEAWQAEDAGEKVVELEREIMDGKYGALSLSMAPAMTRMYIQDQRAKARIADVRALLEVQP